VWGEALLPQGPVPSAANPGREQNKPMDSVKGNLLLASPGLFDPNFRRAVVLVTEHNDEGAAGLVLNRRSETPVADAVPALVPLVSEEELVYIGGPVQQSAVLVLARFEDTDDAAEPIVGDIGFVPGDGDFTVLAGTTRQARVFAGYAGWGPGQLEAELDEVSWIVEPVADLDLFPEPATDLWGTALRRKGGVYRVIAMMPDDPSSN
jgi:putative transcriptional regulator